MGMTGLGQGIISSIGSTRPGRRLRVTNHGVSDLHPLALPYTED